MAKFQYRVPVLLVGNRIGGGGKTSTCTHIADYASHVAGKRVLMIDLDPQCNLTAYYVGMDMWPGTEFGQQARIHPSYEYGMNANERSSICDIFEGKTVLQWPTYIHEAEGGFDTYVEIISGDTASLSRYMSVNSEAALNDLKNTLGAFLHSEEIAQRYDLVIIDTPPTITSLFRAALASATHILVPFQLDSKSVQGINGMNSTILLEQAARNPGVDAPLVNIGYLPSIVDANTTLAKGYLAQAQSFPDCNILEISISRSVEVPKRDDRACRPISLLHLPKKSKIRTDVMAVGAHVMKSIYGNGFEDYADSRLEATKQICAEMLRHTM